MTNVKATRPTYLSLADAAAEIGVSTRTMRRMIAAGDLRAHRPAGRQGIRIRTDDLAAAMRPIPSGALGHE